MFITTEHIERLSFAFVENYAAYDNHGRLHIGKTIRNYIDQNHIKYKGVAEQIGMSRSGFSHLLESQTIFTDRLAQVSKALKHDFFKYLLSAETKEEIVRLAEPRTEYAPEKKKKKPIKVTLQFDDGDPDMDSPLIQKLNEIIRQLNESQE